MERLFVNIPGFRTGIPWKKKVAIIYYLGMAFFIFGISMDFFFYHQPIIGNFIPMIIAIIIGVIGFRLMGELNINMPNKQNLKHSILTAYCLSIIAILINPPYKILFLGDKVPRNSLFFLNVFNLPERIWNTKVVQCNINLEVLFIEISVATIIFALTWYFVRNVRDNKKPTQ